MRRRNSKKANMTVVTKRRLLVDEIGEGSRASCNFYLLVKSCMVIMGNREVTILNNVKVSLVGKRIFWQ